MARKLALAAFALLALLALVLPLTFGLPPLGPPEPTTPSGRAINEVYWFVFALALVVFLAIEATLVLFVFRFRRRADTPPEAEGPQVHGNTRLEISWTVVPAIALAVIAVFTFLRLPTVLADDDPAEVERVRVSARQFYWQYEYQNGALSFDRLFLPVDRLASLELISWDVVHSWWVPELTGKRDAIPGRLNVLNFRPEREGTFTNGKCGEFCGIQHAVMLTDVEVLPQDEYERWLEENAPSDEREALVALGEEEWFAACAKCHGDEGEGDIGPPIQGNPGILDPEPLQRLLFEGQNTPANPGFMPPVGRGWTERQIAALIAYVEETPHLREVPGGGEGAGGG